MTFRTNALKVQAFAGALYGVQVGTTTMAQVNADITSGGGLANTLNSYYASSFGNVANATVAASVAANLGLTGDALASGAAYITAQLNGAAAGARGAVISNILDLFAGLASDATFGAAATAWNAKVDAANAYTGAANVAIGSTVGQGSVFTLTTGVDGVNGGTNFTGGAGNDVFNAVAGAWTALDVIDGGAGNDILNVTETTSAISRPAGATVSNVETINAVTGSTVSLTTTSGFTGLTALNTTSTGGATVVAAATTAVKVTNAGAATGDQAIAVTGGSTVTISSTNNVEDTITVGTTAIPSAGAVTITSSSATASANSAQGSITVNGGTTVSVAQSAANSAATGSKTTAGAVTVNGSAVTTEVTVSDTAAATGFTATATISGVRGRDNGNVTINDVNAASGTAAGTITTVTLNSFAAATIDSSAINTVNLSGTGTSVGIGRGALTATPTANTIAVNVSGLTLTGALTDSEAASDDGFTTVNISSNTTASTVGSIAFADAKTVNVSGDALFTSAGETLTSVTAINVTNTAGAVFATAIGTGVTFTGGDGNDSVVLSNAFTKSHSMGAGNDTVTYGGAASTTTGAKGLMNAGDGNDTIIMTDAEAAAADDSSAFNAAFTNFETLRISNAFDTTIDLDGINGATKVILADAVTGNATINNLSSGGTVEMRVNGASTPSLTIGVRSALSGAADTLNLVLNKDGALAAGTVTAANVETINISNFDAPTAPTLGFDAAAGSMTLVATSATAITVSGNNGLNLTNTGNTKVTSFDASGVKANNTAATATLTATTDSSSGLAVTFVSANTTASATVTITGGAGADTLTGNASKDTINGGAGADTITGGAGQDTLTGGSGADVFVFEINDSAYNAIDVITDLSAADSIVYGNADVAFSGAVTGTGTTATISSAGVATFATIVGVASATLVDKIKILDETLSTNGRAVLFAQDDVTYMYINTDTATTADLTGIVIQLTGVALPASPTTDGSGTGLSGFGA